MSSKYRTHRSVSSLRSSPRKRQHKLGASSHRKMPARSMELAAGRIPVYDRHVYQGGRFVIFYVLDVLKLAIRFLRIPLAALIFFWMLLFLVHRLSVTLKAAFSPLCYVPGISSSTMCLPNSHATPADLLSPRWADFPTLVDVQSATILQLLDESSSGSMLSLQIKKAEMATTDLITLVRVSDLRSRDTLSDTLREFVDGARVTGRALSKHFDGIMAVNDYVLTTLEGVQNDGAPPLSLINQHGPWVATPEQDFVVPVFKESMNYLSSTMQGLIAHLSVLHEIISREDHSISSAKSDLLEELWTKVGGNRRKLRGYENHLHLLKGLTQYRQQALTHVVSALHTLTQMNEDIENLRERVAAPELVGSRIPVEVHVRSIQHGLDRLK
ncbi:hypothetical protein R3P38DRAFT_3333823 [Favolaschia claudopus]|uniref:Uncharacterized protein n=1 Tax=Favolaschia claudopus TaxID=2862362 RepID=A0AAV9ZH71_9AGAR